MAKPVAIVLIVLRDLDDRRSLPLCRLPEVAVLERGETKSRSQLGVRPEQYREGKLVRERHACISSIGRRGWEAPLFRPCSRTDWQESPACRRPSHRPRQSVCRGPSERLLHHLILARQVEQTVDLAQVRRADGDRRWARRPSRPVLTPSPPFRDLPAWRTSHTRSRPGRRRNDRKGKTAGRKELISCWEDRQTRSEGHVQHSRQSPKSPSAPQPPCSSS